MSIEHTRLTQPDLPFHAPASEGALYDAEVRDRHIELRRKFAEAGGAALSDSDILELLLLHSAPRSDTRARAKKLLSEFDTLGDVISADLARLDASIGAVAASDLKLTAEIAKRLSRTKVLQRPLISSWDAVIDYCRTNLAHQPKEAFHVLFLNRANRLIADECLGQGTVDHVPVYPREVLKRALDHNACALILVHNHPSGDPNPSTSDIEMTRQIKTAAAALSITLHDHLIIGAEGEVSMVSTGLI